MSKENYKPWDYCNHGVLLHHACPLCMSDKLELDDQRGEGESDGSR